MSADPTHGRIDRDIQEQVDAMHPRSLGSRVAMENTLQERRDRAKHVPWCGLPRDHDGKCPSVVLCGTPDGTEKTVAEWEAEAARRYPPMPLSVRIPNLLIDLVFCSACFRLRLSPGHWLSCGRRS